MASQLLEQSDTEASLDTNSADWDFDTNDQITTFDTIASKPLKQAAAGGSLFKIQRGIRKDDVLMFTSQLAIMCKSGVDLAEALRESSQSCSHPLLKAKLEDVYLQVSNGVAMSVAMRPHEAIFGGAYIGSIAAAESSGSMPVVLQRLTELIRNQIRLRSSLVSVLAYPIALVAIASLVLLALVFFVLPQFAGVFENMQKTPPPFTQMLLDGATFARSYWILFAGALVGLGIGVPIAWRTERVRGYWDHFVLHGSLLRSAARSLLAGRTFRLLGSMLQSGVPLLEAVRLCRTAVHNLYFQRLLHSIEQQVLSGAGIGSTISQASFLPDGVAQMVATAEKSGRLGDVLEMIGDFYEEDGERQLRQVIKLLEPAIIVFMGLLVSGVVSSVMLPMLDVTTSSS